MGAALLWPLPGHFLRSLASGRPAGAGAANRGNATGRPIIMCNGMRPWKRRGSRAADGTREPNGANEEPIRGLASGSAAAASAAAASAMADSDSDSDSEPEGRLKMGNHHMFFILRHYNNSNGNNTNSSLLLPRPGSSRGRRQRGLETGERLRRPESGASSSPATRRPQTLAAGQLGEFGLVFKFRHHNQRGRP